VPTLGSCHRSLNPFKLGVLLKTLIYATKKLLERAKKWETKALEDGLIREDGLLAAWYATYAIVEKQHVVVLVNDPTFLTVVIHVKEFKLNPAETMRAAIEPLLGDMQIDSNRIAKLLSAVESVRYLPTQNRSMVSRLDRVMLYVTWRIRDARSLPRINMEMTDELYKDGPAKQERVDDYQTPRSRLAAEPGLDAD